MKNKEFCHKREEQVNTREVGVRQRAPQGAEVRATWRASTLEGNDPARYPPEIRAVSALVLTLRQPLMRGRGIQYTETDMRVAELDAQVAAWQFRQQLQKVVSEGLSLYWQAWFAAESRKLREELVRTSTAQLEDARQRVRSGRMAERAVAEVERLRLDRLSEAGRAAQAHDDARVRLLSASNRDARPPAAMTPQPSTPVRHPAPLPRAPPPAPSTSRGPPHARRGKVRHRLGWQGQGR